MAKRIAVIGSGASGLTAIKCCLDEGLQPVCFERTDHIGKYGDTFLSILNTFSRVVASEY